MGRQSYPMGDYTFTRPGLKPLHVTGELRADQTLMYLDRAIAFLHGAAEALGEEIDLCAKDSERASEVTNLRGKVMEIQKAIEAFPRC